MTTASKSSTLAQALAEIQADPPEIALDSTNPHFKSRYPSLAGVMERVLPVTAKHNLAVIQLPTTLDGQPALTTRIVHSSGEQIESTMLLLSAKPDPQGQGAALTYARRYMVLAMLGLVGDEDDDANTASSNGDEQTQPQSTRIGFASDKQKGFFERLLKQGGLDSNEVAGILRFTEQLPTERVSKAIDGLNDNDSELAERTVAALLREADAWARLQSDTPWSDE